MKMTKGNRIPLSIVTGFLGSGKTTLLRRLLENPALKNTILLVNEIADSGVDNRLLRTTTGDVRLLSGGCICCTARDSLQAVLLDLVETGSERGTVERIVIETTGMANPGPLIDAIAGHPMLNARIQINGVIALADCVNTRANAETYPEFANQIAGADAILLAKTDLADQDSIETTLATIKAVNPYADVISGDADVIEFLKNKMATANLFAGRTPAPGWAPLRHSNVQAFCVALEESHDWTVFALWLSLLVHAHGRQVLRVKGLLNIAGLDTPIVINCVQNLVYFPEHLAAWPDAKRESVLVFIVRDIEAACVLQSLRTFLESDLPRLLPSERAVAAQLAAAL
jgi:G3E family GTPase